MHIGSLGTRRAAIDLTFDWFGHDIRVHPDASDLGFAEFLERAAAVTVEDGELSQGLDVGLAAEMMTGYIKSQIHPDDWTVFWRMAVTNRQNTKDLMDVSKAIVEAISDFPTGRPSVSSPGQAPNRAARRSGAGSSLRASRGPRRQVREIAGRPTGSARSATRQALQGQAGRPDLQVVTLRAWEARENGEMAS